MQVKSYKLQQYLVCYIDLLGVREKLFDGINYHSSTVSQEKQEEIDLISTQINTLLEGLSSIDTDMHKYSETLYDLDNKYAKIDSFISKDEYISQIEMTHLSVQQFSDSTLIYVPFSYEAKTAIINMLCVWITSLAIWNLRGMSQGIMFRGAMTIGTAWELRTQCLFGPAVHEVYHLESESAKHPRIVISKDLKDFINECLESNRKAGIDIDNIPTALHMIHTDDDGVDMLHYLSKVTRHYIESYGNINEGKQLISKSFDHLLNEYNFYYKDANTNPKSAELARRYLMVIRYFMRYNANWDDCILALQTTNTTTYKSL